MPPSTHAFHDEQDCAIVFRLGALSPGDFFSLEAAIFVTAIAVRFALRLAATTEINRLTDIRVLFATVMQNCHSS
jgi:hypothetical protein